IDATQMAKRIAQAVSMRMDCAFHATELEELELAVGALEIALGRGGVEPSSHIHFRIEHGGVIPPEYPVRLAALGAWVVTNPGFIYYRGAKYVTEPGLIPYLYRARTVMDAGVRMAGGTDAPVTPAKPLNAIAAAVSRGTQEGY